MKSTHFLILRNAEGDIWLEKRPSQGIWGGLWCFPEVTSPEAGAEHCLHRWQHAPGELEVWDDFRHTFSHYHLDITPVLATLDGAPGAVMEGDGQLWYNVRQPPQIGLAAPVASLLEKLAGEH